MSKGAQIAVAVVSVAVAAVWFLASAEGTFRYYQSVDELLAEGSDATSGRGLRVHGFVVEGSILKDLPAGHVDFAIGGGERGHLPVRYVGTDVPDLFRDGAEVVVEGRIEDGRFVASRLLAKCPSKYETAPGAEA